MSDAAVLELRDVVRTFHQGDTDIEVLRGVNLALHAGETVALTGPSGAGKSTLLHIAGLLERPGSGDVLVAERACANLGDAERTRLRCESLGFIYQFHYLLPEFSALENVMLPQMIAGRSRTQARERAAALLESLGLRNRESHRPARLSGGEQQRVAIARAVANVPAVLLADEPTGNLDEETAEVVFDALLCLVRESGLGALVATHNEALARRMDRWVRFEAGRLVERNPA